jgi:hypothetical protein
MLMLTPDANFEWPDVIVGSFRILIHACLSIGQGNCLVRSKLG